ncbi:unnamed protein product, partial [Mesorhabditis belari]|uniref:Apple domain-containing protein n=1 Tax=Mesorhabditis belari TaxID=2138241 RepID=A0AAF3FCE9_9BILA
MLSFRCTLLFLCLSSMAVLPATQYVGQKPYFLKQSTECKGPKVYEIRNVQDVDQCKEACVQFNCAAVNLFQLGEFQFMCEILSHVYTSISQQGAACYVGGGQENQLSGNGYPYYNNY